MTDTSDRSRKMSFSSEKAVVQRWFGGEILDHSPSSVRMDFMKSGRAPLLLNHDTRAQIGVIDDASIGKDRVARATARFGRTGAASDALQNVDDKILTNTSVGYRVFEMVLDTTKKGEDDVYRVIDWEPYEVTLCAVPADQNVGVGRSLEDSFDIDSTSAGGAGLTQEDRKMDENQGATVDSGNRSATGGEPNATGAGGESAALARAGAQISGSEIDNQRMRAIRNLCKANNIEERLERMWITSGISVEKVSEDLLRVIEQRGKANPRPVSKLDLTEREQQSFSVRKAILAAFSNDWTNAGFEAECSRAIMAKMPDRHPDPKRFYVPYDVQQRGISRSAVSRRDAMLGKRNGLGAMTRADTVGSGAGGGFLVATELVSFIDLLRNRAVAFRMGARSLAGLVGNVQIPKLTGAAQAFWLGSETSQINGGASSNQTFSQLSLVPHNVGGYTELSRQLLMQSTPDAEGIVNSDLAIITALAVDLGAIAGTGTGGQPVGIINTAGINSEGAITSTGTFASVLDMQTLVANQNVVPMAGGYVAPFNVSAILATRTKFANTYSPIWDGTIWDGDVCGFPAMGSKQMTASTLLFGDWDQLIIAEWGVLELEVNPYANFQAGIIGVRSFMTVDIGLRYTGAMTYCTSVA